MILKNHGLLSTGRSIAEAFVNLWGMERACEVQTLADSTGRPGIRISDAILAKSEQLAAIQSMGEPAGQLEFDAYTRLIEKIDPTYKT